MNRADAAHAIFLARLGQDGLAFADRERLEYLVVETVDPLALVVVAHPAFKGGERAGAMVRHRPGERRDVERCA